MKYDCRWKHCKKEIATKRLNGIGIDILSDEWTVRGYKFSSKDLILISLRKVFFFSRMKTLNFPERLPQIIAETTIFIINLYRLRGLFDKYDNYGCIKWGGDIHSDIKRNNFLSGILKAYRFQRAWEIIEIYARQSKSLCHVTFNCRHMKTIYLEIESYRLLNAQKKKKEERGTEKKERWLNFSLKEIKCRIGNHAKCAASAKLSQ